jgi:heat shock protein HslJ
MRTRTTIAGLAIAITALAGCSTNGGASGGANNAEGGTGGELTGNIWVLETYEQDGTRKEVPGDVTVDAAFDGSTSTVSGSAGCNQYNGPYTLSGADLTFGAIKSTMMGCVGAGGDVESAYLANLALVKSFTATEDTLTLHDANHTAILSYSAAAAGTLDGVTWHATAINNGNEAVVSVAAGTDPTAVYEKAGTVTGNAGCNSFNGPAVVDGSNVKIGPLMSTKMACADEAANAQETAYLAALEKATTFEVRGSHLELRDAQGALQVSFETR